MLVYLSSMYFQKKNQKHYFFLIMYRFDECKKMHLSLGGVIIHILTFLPKMQPE